MSTSTPDPLDQTSQQIDARLKTAAKILSEAEQIFAKETTDQHRQQWPNVYRLESATWYAQKAIALSDPRVTRERVADALVSAATLARDTIREAVDTGGGSLIDAAEGLLNAVAESAPARLSAAEAEAAGSAAIKRLEQLQVEIDTRQRRVDEQMREQDASFQDALAKRTERFDGELQRIEGEMNTARSGFEDRAGEAQEHISELETELSQTAAALGGSAVAIDNDAESREQSELANRWTIVTVVLVAAAAVLPLVLGVAGAKQSPESVAGKLAIGFILAGAAAYTAGVARHHRQRAATARRLAIELNAFGPFIAPLEKIDRDDLRSTIIWRFFGPPDTVNQEIDDAPEPGPGLIEALRLRRKRRADASSNEEPPESI